MFDKFSRETIEDCLSAAENAMKRVNISTAASVTGIDKPHGFVNLAYFHDDFTCTRMYRLGDGKAPFRNFIRGLHTDEHRRQVFDLLTQLKRLEPYFHEYLAETVEIPEVTEAYVEDDLRLKNKPAWPDDLYYNLTYKAEEVFRNSTRYMVPGYVNHFDRLSEIAPEESKEVPAHLRREHAIKNAIDLVCTGPWAGISVPRIIRALEKLHADLSRDKHDVEPPILQCLEPKTTRRLTLPLWRAGRFHGVFSVITGGALEQLGPLDKLERECTSVSHLLFSVLQRERERRARKILRSGQSHGPLDKLIREAACALAAPHYICDVAVTDSAHMGDSSDVAGGKADGPRLQFSIQENLFGQRVRVDVELFDEERPIIRELMESYIKRELQRIDWEMRNGPPAELGTTGTGLQNRRAINEFALRTLQDYRGDSALPNKEYFLGFISLAILKQPDVQIVKISGQKVYNYQKELAEQYGIFRNQDPNRGRGNRKAQNNVYLSHLATRAALEYVQEKLPELEIAKRHNLIEIRFGNVSPNSNSAP